MFKTIGFLIIPALFLALVTLLVQPTPRMRTSLLFAQQDKDTLLHEVAQPRVILVGGSNVSFGINSQIIKDSLHVNPVNTGIHASLGLKYMMDHIVKYVQPGDVIILIPEYSHYFGNNASGNEELLRTVVDVDRSSLTSLNLQQWQNIITYVPTVAFSKLRISEYTFTPAAQIGVYERRSFNQYGDAYLHWGLQREHFEPYLPAQDPFNNAVIEDMITFQKQVLERGGLLYISFPGIQDISFDNLNAQIHEVETQLRARGFKILGSPERYKISDTFMYNTPYHLNKAGVDYRTQLLVEDLRTIQR